MEYLQMGTTRDQLKIIFECNTVCNAQFHWITPQFSGHQSRNLLCQINKSNIFFTECTIKKEKSPFHRTEYFLILLVFHTLNY